MSLKPKRVPRRNTSDFTTSAVFVALFTSPALAQTSAGHSRRAGTRGRARVGARRVYGPRRAGPGAADGTVYFSDRMPDRTYHLGIGRERSPSYQENTGAA